MPVLHLGNKNYSSWSLRPWLVLRWAGIQFDEEVIPLGSDGYGRGRMPELLARSPTGRVPALSIGDDTVWDSLAIALWAAEQAPELWPSEPRARAECRSVVCEMHSGFAGVRRDLSMNLRRRVEVSRPLPDDTEADLARLAAMWSGLRSRYGGPWLFGARSMADASYAPVATRLRSYGVALPAEATGWCAALFADADFREWEASAEAEPWRIAETDRLHAGR